MRLELKILGSNSAIPSHNRNPTSQLLSYHSNAYLIDCGEGTQMRMSQYKVKRSKIKHIFISHLHGDHIFGLPGLITSYALSSREEDLHIHGPIGLKKFIETMLEISESHLTYKLYINELEANSRKLVLEDKYLNIYAFPLQHRIATVGYRFDEKQAPVKLDTQLIEQHQLEGNQIKQLREGSKIKSVDGSTLEFADILLPSKRARSYSYCSDTVYDETIVPHIAESSLLYHEATYLDEMRDQAKERMHSTALEAAKIADLAKVNQLIIGHYSSRYSDLSPLLSEAQSQFPNTKLAIEGETHEIPHNN